MHIAVLYSKTKMSGLDGSATRDSAASVQSTARSFHTKEEYEQTATTTYVRVATGVQLRSFAPLLCGLQPCRVAGDRLSHEDEKTVIGVDDLSKEDGAVPETIREEIELNSESQLETFDVASNGTAVQSVQLDLRVTDPEVIAELKCHIPGAERERFGLAALRIGVLALRTATGQLDAAAIREAGNRLVSDVQRELGGHAANLLGDLRSILKGYFDLETGLLPQRIEALVKKDGDLERLLRSHLGPDDSVLARTLAERIGEKSPLFKVLSATDKNGLLCQVAGAINSELEQQRSAILKEFSLDNENSALSRLIARVLGSNEEFAERVENQISAMVGEFSLDRGDSALSRLVAKVESAQKLISAEFSTDNDESAISRLSRLLADTSLKIDSSLTLDSDKSALYVVRTYWTSWHWN